MTQEEILRMLSVEPLEIAEAERVTAAPLYGKIPFSRLAALGVGLDAVVPALQQLMSGGKAMSGYYKVTIPAGTELARFKMRMLFWHRFGQRNRWTGKAESSCFSANDVVCSGGSCQYGPEAGCYFGDTAEMLEFLVKKKNRR